MAAACGDDSESDTTAAPTTTTVAEMTDTVVDVAVARDEAFAPLPKGTLSGLPADTTALHGVLTHHVVLGKVPAADVRHPRSRHDLRR